MRCIRPLTVAVLAALAPLSRGAGQTCQGTAEFREGKARAGIEYQHSSDLDYYRESVAYGVHDSFFGDVGADQTHLSQGGASLTGIGGSLGYQLHWTATPFQVCPLVTLEHASGNGGSTTSVGFGGSLGYHIFLQPGFRLVPAAGVRWISTDVVRNSGSQSGGTTSGTETFLDFGMVLNHVWTFVPGVLFPSPASAKTRWTFELTYNFGPNSVDAR